jgi:hypothetical protein
MRKLTPVTIIIFALLLSTTFGAIIINVALADPLPAWLVNLKSPQNNKIYPTNTVEINFAPSPEFNFTSFSYSLDGQAAQPTNGNTILTGLSEGTHKLTIYSTGNYFGGNQSYTNVAAMVQFSIVYSPSLIIFSILLVAVIIGIALPLFIKRKPIMARLKGEKTASFWLGIACFLFFAAIFLVPSISIMTYDYVFPPALSYRLVAEMPPAWLFLIIGLIFMVFGLILMIIGTRKR